MAVLMSISRINKVKSVFKRLQTLQLSGTLHSYQNQNGYASEVTATAVPLPKKENISKAMKAYLERAQEHDNFMKTERIEFEIGKRHLANMMGEDPETFTQEQVDEAIEYLFPSGLYDKKARPLMKPPEQVFPQRKAAEFDENGKPYHSMFYTGQPNFYALLYQIVEEIQTLNQFEDRMLRRQNLPDKNMQFDLSGSAWISKEDLEELLVENIADIEYGNFSNAMDRLASLPYSNRAEVFIKKYRQPLMKQSNKYEIAQAQLDADGRFFVTVYECLRKTARGDVTIRSPGTGKITINGQDINYFESTQCREQDKFYVLITKLECIDQHPDLCADLMCNIKPVNRTMTLLNLGCNMTKITHGFMVCIFNSQVKIKDVITSDLQFRYQLNYKTNIFRPFLIDFTQDMCKLMGNRYSAIALNSVTNVISNYTNLIHACPFEGWNYVKDFPVTSDIANQAMPTGEYRADMRFFNHKNQTVIFARLYATFKARGLNG